MELAKYFNMKHILRAYFKHLKDVYNKTEKDNLMHSYNAPYIGNTDNESFIVDGTIYLEHMSNWIYNYMKDNK